MSYAGRQIMVQISNTLSERRGARMRTIINRLWREEQGQDLTEYALLLVLLSLAAVAFLGTLAGAINNVFSNAAANLTTAT
jgi:pilus assembly protein Flp/PilA